MGLDTSNNVRVVRGDLQRNDRLPKLPASQPWVAPFPDLVGEGITASPLLVGATFALAGIGSALAIHRALPGQVVKSVVGGVGAGVFAAGVAAELVGRHEWYQQVAHGRHEPTARSSDPERVKVMTYNLHGGMGGPHQFGGSTQKLDDLAAAIRREDPDIVLLQEVDENAPRSMYFDTLEGLADRLGPTSAVEGAPGSSITGHQQHVAVMTFHGFRVDNARDIIHGDNGSDGIGRRLLNFLHIGNDPSYQPRNSLDTIVETPGGNDIRVATGHYGWPSGGAGHQQQGQDLPLAAALDAWDGPTLLGADFNVHSDDAAHYGLERDAFAAASMGDTFTTAGVAPDDAQRGSLLNGAPIDRIYATHHFTVNAVYVDKDAGDASDHYPVVADLTLAPGAPPTP